MSESLSQSDDELLVHRCQAGDQSAFAVLVERYWHRLHGWLYALSGCTHSAEDLTQEAFCKAWTGLAGYESGPGFSAWLFRIARNAWLDHSRRVLGNAGPPAEERAIARDVGPHDAAIEREGNVLLQEAIGSLPSELRETFLLRTQQSLSFREIAAVAETTEETVRWRLYKARQLLLKKLASHLSSGKSKS